MPETLSFRDFVHYRQESGLGQLNLPNGKTKRLFGLCSKDNLFVKLSSLYRLIDRMITERGLALDNVIAVIAIGSAVLFPGYRETYQTRRKFIFFGPWTISHKLIPIQPNDVDFLVVTDKNLGYAGAWLKRDGLHLINRGTEQMSQCVQVNDTASMHALREGIPIFFDEKWKLLVAKIGIRSNTPRKIYWVKNESGCLSGTIC